MLTKFFYLICCQTSVILVIPALRQIFSIWKLPVENIVEVVCLVFAPLVIVEIFKALKINCLKDE